MRTSYELGQLQLKCCKLSKTLDKRQLTETVDWDSWLRQLTDTVIWDSWLRQLTETVDWECQMSVSGCIKYKYRVWHFPVMIGLACSREKLISLLIVSSAVTIQTSWCLAELMSWALPLSGDSWSLLEPLIISPLQSQRPRLQCTDQPVIQTNCPIISFQCPERKLLMISSPQTFNTKLYPFIHLQLNINIFRFSSWTHKVGQWKEILQCSILIMQRVFIK